MSNPKKTHELIRQNEQIVKKSQKHDVNLQKNSTLYFQIGLIVCLLAVFGLFEMTFETTITDSYVRVQDPPDFVTIPLIKPTKPVFDEPVEHKKVTQSQKLKEVPNNKELEKFVEGFVEPQINAPDINPDFGGLIDKPDPVEDVLFISVEVVPIYPGCENKKTNDDKRKCMSDKIAKLVKRKFDANLASELGLSGKQTIRTQFKIDKTGHITDVKANGTHPELEKEAQRVINKIPEMIPGKQRDKNVGVIYSLPIVFQVQN